MNRKRGVNNENKLLYDPNQRQQRRLGAFSMQEIEEPEEETVEENEQDESIESEEQETLQNNGQQVNEEIPQNNNVVKESLAQAKKVAGNTAKTAVKNVAKKAGSAVAKVAGQIAMKLLAFIIANPWVLAILGIAVLIIIFIVILVGGSSESTGEGYYDKQCNFNESVVTLTTCNTTETTEMPLDKYVIGTTYSLVKDGTYSNETIKALMVVIKTNALSYGGYNSSDKDLTLDDCSIPFVSVADGDSDLYDSLSNIYNEIENNIYVASSYQEVISSMSAADALPINDSIISQMETLASESNQYNTILDNIYNNSENIVNSAAGTIYVGDSRTQGMVLAGAIDAVNAVYGVGYGYNWFIGNGSFNANNTNATSGAIAAVNSKIGSGSYNIVIWLGVNDYTNFSAEDYYNKYYELATGDWKNQNIYIVAVGPVDDNLAQNVDNAGINNFNNEMANLIRNTNVNNLHYINLNYSIQSYDSMGVHYSNADYVEIHEQISNNITTGRNVDLAIYDLSTYCTFYTVTENDAYWWPIGSTNATNGNVYGGNPSTTNVSSPYGPRTINGIYSFHKGVDIAATCNQNVIIATKSGTVTKVNDTCPSYGSYQNDCGGGYGNYVMIDHGDGTSSVYAHMYSGSVTVNVGDTVQQGEKVGMMGSSGSSTGCHLHFEIRINDSQVDPLEYISADNPRPVVRNISIDAGSEGGQQAVCQALLDSGFSENATIGIMVNVNAESGFRTDAVEYSSGYTIDNIYSAPADVAAGFGLFQWSFGRRINVINYARNNGMDPTSLQAQLEYFVQELNTSYPVTLKYVTGNYSAYDIATNFCLDFERPANKNTTCPNRATNYVDMFTSYVKNGCS